MSQNIKNYLHSFVNIFFIFCFLTISNFSFASVVFQPKLPDEIGVNISWKSLKKYNDFYRKIISEEYGLPIKEKYKKNFSGKVYFNENEKVKVLPARIRITGDLKDHIDYEKGITSLKIKLLKGNLGHIVRFRVLIPGTKNFYDEIFWSSLIEVLGYPSLYKKIVKVNLNGIVTQNFLFEEIPSKEFLERFKFRESPILEADERLFWKINYEFRKKCINMLLNTVVISQKKNCMKNIKADDYVGWKVDNKAFIKNETAALIAFNSLYKIYNEEDHFKENNIINKFDKLNLNYNASHGLRKHNRKFIYDPILNNFIPIYFDGDVVLPAKCNINKDNIVNDNLKKKFDKFKKVYLERAKVKLKQNQKCAAKNILANEYNYFFKKEMNIGNNLLKLNISSKIKNSYVLNFDELDNKYKICDTNNDCNKINFFDTKRILSGQNPKEINLKKDKSILLKKENFSSNKKNIYIENFLEKQKFIVKENQTIFFKDTGNIKDLDIYLENAISSKFVIYGSNLINTKIKLISPNDNKKLINNYDENLLTGCLTIVNSKINISSIEVLNAKCEDGLNFIDVNGTVKSIKIKNSRSDSLDADFSKINFDEILVLDSKNDCVDFSGGNYQIKKLNVKNCGDKGLSVGEKSKVNIKNFISKDNKIDFVSKDSSKLYLNQFVSNKQSNEICGSAYNKKQEFNGGQIIFESIPSCVIEKDEFSEIIFKK